MEKHDEKIRDRDPDDVSLVSPRRPTPSAATITLLEERTKREQDLLSDDDGSGAVE